MHDRLRAALGPVLADVRATTALDLAVEDRPWSDQANQPSAFLRLSDGTGAGVSVWLLSDVSDDLRFVADQVQDWLVENVGGTQSNWPVCPQHPTTHPMTATVVEEVACWACPVDGTVGARVGELGR